MKDFCPKCGVPLSEYYVTESSTYCPKEGIEPEECGMEDDDEDEC